MTGFSRVLVMAVLALGLMACGDDKQEAAAPQKQLDGVVLERLDGAREPLKAYRGKMVLLNVWATWCGPCRREMAGLQKLADRLDPAEYAVIGLSIDRNPALVREFLRGKNLPFATHIDPTGELTAERWGISAVPTTIVIGKNGELLWVEVGERAWDADTIPQWLRGLS
ncbi:MAG: TlpA family protein disulfide reductase [Rhodospirillaceae bacterium]|nr:TlpA family protein disulfide reductase [Rhodospirillales bacterium]